MKNLFLLLTLAAFITFNVQGQDKSKSEKKEKTFDEIITKKAFSDKGLFAVYDVDGKFYYEIPDALLGKEMLMVTRIAKTANGLGFGGGKQNTQVVRWVKKRKQILLIKATMKAAANRR